MADEDRDRVPSPRHHVDRTHRHPARANETDGWIAGGGWYNTFAGCVAATEGFSVHTRLPMNWDGSGDMHPSSERCREN